LLKEEGRIREVIVEFATKIQQAVGSFEFRGSRCSIFDARISIMSNEGDEKNGNVS
jgi:hypothetical protein